MKLIRDSLLFVGAVAAIAPGLRAQDLSKYRAFAVGASLQNILKLSDQKLVDVKTVHAEPMLLQELTWWPPSSSGSSSQPDAVEQILFSFSNGVLYKISVSYDRHSTEGLTVPDMVKSISAEYGPPTSVQAKTEGAFGHVVLHEGRAAGVLGKFAILVRVGAHFVWRTFWTGDLLKESECRGGERDGGSREVGRTAAPREGSGPEEEGSRRSGSDAREEPEEFPSVEAFLLQAGRRAVLEFCNSSKWRQEHDSEYHSSA